MNDGNQMQKLTTQGDGSPVLAAGRDLTINIHSGMRAELRVPDLSADAKNLVIRAAQTDGGRIVIFTDEEGITVGGEMWDLPVENTVRNRAYWRRVARELVVHGLVDSALDKPTEDSQVFDLNDAGFRLADSISEGSG